MDNVEDETPSDGLVLVSILLALGRAIESVSQSLGGDSDDANPCPPVTGFVPTEGA